MNEIKSYDINYYVTTKDELELARKSIPYLKQSAHNGKTLAEVALTEKAYAIESHLFQMGIDKFMYRRELDQYVSNPDNGVTLRKIQEYDRLVPTEVIKPMEMILQTGGDVLVLSFNEEVVSARPVISNPLLRDSVEKSAPKAEVSIEKVKVLQKPIDPIIFGLVRVGGKVCEKIWILGAWINKYPHLSTSESLIAYLNSTFTKGDSRKFQVNMVY